jgi:hypothetical protein
LLGTGQADTGLAKLALESQGLEAALGLTEATRGLAVRFRHDKVSLSTSLRAAASNQALEE